MKKIINYLKAVKWWAETYYPEGWMRSKEYRKIRIRNALYCVSPWRTWDKFIDFCFGTR